MESKTVGYRVLQAWPEYKGQQKGVEYLENSAINVVRDTKKEVGATEEVTAEAEVKTVTTSSQTYQSGVTKTSEIGSEHIKIPLFFLRMNYWG